MKYSIGKVVFTNTDLDHVFVQAVRTDLMLLDKRIQKYSKPILNYVV